MIGIEPTTTSLATRYSTPELHQQIMNYGGEPEDRTLLTVLARDSTYPEGSP